MTTDKMGLLRLLEWIFFFYFFSHIPITILIDSQAVLPAWLYPEMLRNTILWYCREFRDPFMMEPPAWFMSFCLCEVTLQFPFFFVGAYAFWKGGCKWVKIPALVYSSHVATTVIAILYHVLIHDFSDSKHPAPRNLNERLFLCSIYSPYLIIPLMIICTMLFHPAYQPNTRIISKSKKRS